MPVLNAASPEIIQLLEKCKQDWREPVPEFSTPLRRELLRALGAVRNVQLIEMRCTLGEYCDTEAYRRRRKGVLKQLHAESVTLPAGKKPSSAMQAFVSDVVPLLLAMGVPEASGEYSRLVALMRLIAGEIGLAGDPRRELRRQIGVERRSKAHARQVVHDVWVDALRQVP